MFKADLLAKGLGTGEKLGGLGIDNPVDELVG